jgi:predicted dehydrogenase
MNPSLTRRKFLAAGTSALILPSSSPAAALPRSERLHLAAIGMGGRIQGLVDHAMKLGHEVTAFCDVDERQLAASKKRRPQIADKVHSYQDYRVLLEKEKTLDAVIIATPDHWHAPICHAAMDAGKHVFCEKPLTHTLEEARTLRERTRRSKVVTQTGNQGSASSNLRRSMELLAAGLFGDITDIHVWHPGLQAPYGTQRPQDSDPVPEGLDWDFWVGPAPSRPFKEALYHPAQWRAWYDFGNGTLGDFCCHSFNLPVRALALDYPDKILVRGEKMGLETFPVSSTTSFHFPAKGDRREVMLHFHVGDPPPEERTEELRKTFGGLPRVGCLFHGTKGQLSAGLWNSQCYVRLNGEAKFLGADNHEAAKPIAQTLPRSKGHLEEWLDACRGEGTTFADFDFGGHLTEIGLAGIVALKLQQDIPWDGPAMKVPGMPEADRLVRKENRPDYL